MRVLLEGPEQAVWIGDSAAGVLDSNADPLFIGGRAHGQVPLRLIQ